MKFKSTVMTSAATKRYQNQGVFGLIRVSVNSKYNG